MLGVLDKDLVGNLSVVELLKSKEVEDAMRLIPTHSSYSNKGRIGLRGCAEFLMDVVRKVTRELDTDDPEYLFIKEKTKEICWVLRSKYHRRYLGYPELKKKVQKFFWNEANVFGVGIKKSNKKVSYEFKEENKNDEDTSDKEAFKNLIYLIRFCYVNSFFFDFVPPSIEKKGGTKSYLFKRQYPEFNTSILYHALLDLGWLANVIKSNSYFMFDKLDYPLQDFHLIDFVESFRSLNDATRYLEFVGNSSQIVSRTCDDDESFFKVLMSKILTTKGYPLDVDLELAKEFWEESFNLDDEFKSTFNRYLDDEAFSVYLVEKFLSPISEWRFI